MRISDWSSDVCSSDLVFRIFPHYGKHPIWRSLSQYFPHFSALFRTFSACGKPLDARRASAICRTMSHYQTSSRTRRSSEIRRARRPSGRRRSEEHTSELQSLMRISYAVFCLKKKKLKLRTNTIQMKKYKTQM